MVFEIQTSAGVKRWEGTDGLNACERYANEHPTETVYAWRYPQTELHVGMIQIAETATNGWKLEG